MIPVPAPGVSTLRSMVPITPHVGIPSCGQQLASAQSSTRQVRTAVAPAVVNRLTVLNRGVSPGEVAAGFRAGIWSPDQ
jgi:hypothetical protein